MITTGDSPTMTPRNPLLAPTSPTLRKTSSQDGFTTPPNNTTLLLGVNAVDKHVPEDIFEHQDPWQPTSQPSNMQVQTAPEEPNVTCPNCSTNDRRIVRCRQCSQVSCVECWKTKSTTCQRCSLEVCDGCTPRWFEHQPNSSTICITCQRREAVEASQTSQPATQPASEEIRARANPVSYTHLRAHET